MHLPFGGYNSARLQGAYQESFVLVCVLDILFTFFFSCNLHAHYWGTEERSQPLRMTRRPCPLKRVVTAVGNVISVRFPPVRCCLPAQASLRPPVEQPRRGVIATDMKMARRRRRTPRRRSRNVTCSWLHLSHLFSFPFAAETSGERSSGGTFLREWPSFRDALDNAAKLSAQT